MAAAPNQTLTVDGLGDFKAKVHDALFERLGTRLFEATNEEQLQSLVVTEIGALMDATETALSPHERQHLVQDIARDVMGLGPIEQFLADPTVTEVMVNGSNFIYAERNGVIEQTGARFISEDHLRRVIDRIVSSVGRRIDEASPMVDARLPDGSRVNVIVPPLSLDGSILTIRKFAKDPFRVDRPGRHGNAHRAGGFGAGGHGGGRDEHPHLRRHGHRQDDDAQRAVELRSDAWTGSSPSRTPSSCSCSRST